MSPAPWSSWRSVWCERCEVTVTARQEPWLTGTKSESGQERPGPPVLCCPLSSLGWLQLQQLQLQSRHSRHSQTLAVSQSLITSLSSTNNNTKIGNIVSGRRTTVNVASWSGRQISEWKSGGEGSQLGWRCFLSSAHRSPLPCWPQLRLEGRHDRLQHRRRGKPLP